MIAGVAVDLDGVTSGGFGVSTASLHALEAASGEMDLYFSHLSRLHPILDFATLTFDSFEANLSSPASKMGRFRHVKGE